MVSHQDMLEWTGALCLHVTTNVTTIWFLAQKRHVHPGVTLSQNYINWQFCTLFYEDTMYFTAPLQPKNVNVIQLPLS